MNRSKVALVVGLLSSAVPLSCGGASEAPPAEKGPAPARTAAAVKYQCPMHPDVVRDAPGRCPTCNMNLEPAGGSTTPAGAKQGAAPTGQ